MCWPFIERGEKKPWTVDYPGRATAGLQWGAGGYGHSEQPPFAAFPEAKQILSAFWEVGSGCDLREVLTAPQSDWQSQDWAKGMAFLYR